MISGYDGRGGHGHVSGIGGVVPVQHVTVSEGSTAKAVDDIDVGAVADRAGAGETHGKRREGGPLIGPRVVNVVIYDAPAGLGATEAIDQPTHRGHRIVSSGYGITSQLAPEGRPAGRGVGGGAGQGGGDSA